VLIIDTLPLGHQCVATLLEFKGADLYIGSDGVKRHQAGHGRPGTAPGVMQGNAHARIVLESVERNSPLHWAAFKGHLRIVWRLMSAGLDIHDVDACGNSALHLAVAGDNQPVVLSLLSNGADLNAKNYYGNSPLDLTTKSDMRKTLHSLLQQRTYFHAKRFMMQLSATD
jgi:ankyrin repeat protein